MGKKPYAQKKTGRAHHSSQRTPLRPGGGVIFGPKPKDWSIKMNRKEKRLAISSTIATAIVDEDALVVVEDGFAQELGKMGRPMTREFVKAMRRWGLDPKVHLTLNCKKFMKYWDFYLWTWNKVACFLTDNFASELRRHAVVQAPCRYSSKQGLLFYKRITISEIIDNDWFKKGYKPPNFETVDVNLDDVHDVFNESGEPGNLVVERRA